MCDVSDVMSSRWDFFIGVWFFIVFMLLFAGVKSLSVMIPAPN